MQNPLSKISEVLELKSKKATTHTVAPDASVFDAIGIMNRNKIGSAVVLEEGRVVGIFTERDVLTRVVGADLNPHTTQVAQVMTQNPLCVTGSMLAKDVMAVATDKHCRHFPVVENDRLVGLISTGDLVHFEARDQENRIDAALRAMLAATVR